MYVVNIILNIELRIHNNNYWNTQTRIYNLPFLMMQSQNTWMTMSEEQYEFYMYFNIIILSDTSILVKKCQSKCIV